MKSLLLSKIGKVVTGKTPQTANSEYYNGGYMFVTPNELHDGYIIQKSNKTLTEKGMNSIKTNTIEGVSVLVGCIGWDMGNVAMTVTKCATNQQINSITSIRPDVNPYYLYYWLSGKKKYLFSIASVTRTPILSKSVFESIFVPIPDIVIQNKIASILTSIDAKIAINKQINDNLAAMICDFYMHEFFRREPNGKLGDIISEEKKSTIQVGTAKDLNGEYPFFTSGDAVLSCDKPLVNNRICLLNTGGNADVKFYVGPASYSTDTWCITGTDGLSDYLFTLLYSIKQELNLKFFLGTGLKHLQKPLLKNRPIYVPNEIELKTFNSIAMPAYTTISSNQRENRALVALRDWLLPMLMNGQAIIED